MWDALDNVAIYFTFCIPSPRFPAAVPLWPDPIRHDPPPIPPPQQQQQQQQPLAEPPGSNVHLIRIKGGRRAAKVDGRAARGGAARHGGVRWLTWPWTRPSPPRRSTAAHLAHLSIVQFIAAALLSRFVLGCDESQTDAFFLPRAWTYHSAEIPGKASAGRLWARSARQGGDGSGQGPPVCVKPQVSSFLFSAPPPPPPPRPSPYIGRCEAAGRCLAVIGDCLDAVPNTHAHPCPIPRAQAGRAEGGVGREMLL